MLATSPITGYTLSNILTGEALAFDAQGRYLSDTDAYGNQNSLTAGTNTPTGETNSNVNDHTTGRSLAFTYNANGLLADAQSPLWQQGGTGKAGSQHVAYGYNAQGQLTSLTRGAGTGDALTDMFGYSGTQLVTVTTGAGHQWTLGYDGQGRLTSITSPVSGAIGQAGYTPSDTTQFTYGVSQTMAIEGYGSSQPLTHTSTLDAQGNAPQTMDVSGQGHVRVAAYDVDHDVISGTDGLGNTTVYTYSYAGPTGSVGLLTQETQPGIRNGSFSGPTTPVVTSYVYDPTTHDRVETDRPNGGVVRDTYDGRHSVAIETERLSLCQPSCQTYQRRGTINQYDAYGELVKSTDGRGVDATGDGVATLDPTTGISYTSAYTYSMSGDQIAARTPPLTTTVNGTPRANTPSVTTSAYDGDGNEITSTSANGNTTTSAYDHLGRLVQTTAPRVPLFDGSSVAPTTTTGYDGNGNVVSTRDASGALTTNSYDPLGRLVAETNPVSGTQLMTYTATREAFDQDPGGAVTAYRYNAGGQVNHVSDPVSGTVDYTYNAVGNVTAITTSDGTGAPGGVASVETRGYDALNRVITDSVGGPNTITQTTQTAYDLDGNVAGTLQPNGDAVYNVYDLANQLTGMEVDSSATRGGPGIVQTAYSYDNAGNQIEAIDFDGRDHTAAYDADNRVVRATDTDSYGAPTMATTTQYDPDGNVVGQTMQSGGQTSTYAAAYNAADWAMSETRDGVRTSYGYDAAGRRRTETALNDGVPITTQLDPQGRATAIGENLGGTGPYTSAFTYTPINLPRTTTMPNGTGETAGYDPANRLTHVGAVGPTKGTAAQTLSSGYDYGYDARGRITAVTATLNGGTPRVQTVAHDALDRVTQAQSGGATQAWTYDGNGNISTTVTGGVTTVYGYGAVPNEVTTVTTPGQPARYYGYDKNGDTTSITDGATLHTGLRYDSRARLAQVTLADGTQVGMGYNAVGERARYTVTRSGATVLGEAFTYRGSKLGQAVVTGTSVTAPYTDTYLYDRSGRPLELLRQQQGGATNRYWYALDGRDNVVALTDISGTVVDRYAYDLWGQPVAAGTSESVAQPLRYAGYWYDAALGWYWVGVRAYDPQLERWVQPDASGADGVRTYAYVADDPSDYIDPTGQDEVAGIPGSNNVNFLVAAGAAVLVVATLPVDLAVLVPGVVVGVGTAVVIGGVTYVVRQIRFGPTRTVTIPAYIPRPGDVQSTPIVGGTTATIPGQIPIPNIMHVKGEYVPSGLTKSERNKYREAVHIYKDDFDLPAPYVTPRHILDQIANAIKGGANPYDAAGEADAPPEGKQ